jgi:hypothetical protein
VRTVVVILQMALTITALLVAVGVAFYALVWVSLMVASSFPIIGRRHRHQRWDDLNKPVGRALEHTDSPVPQRGGGVDAGRAPRRSDD